MQRYDAVVCGYGPVGALLAARLAALGASVLVVERAASPYPLPRAVAADGEVLELLARGTRPDDIVVVDCAPARLREVEALGISTVEGDATHNAVLESAGIGAAASAIVTTGRDDTAVLVMLTIRRLAPRVRVSCSIAAVENEPMARDAGADVIVNPISFGGQLLAGSTSGPHLADYVAELVTRGGDADLHEREVTAEEVGLAPADIRTGQVLRLYRGDRCLLLDSPAAARLEAGDVLIEVVPHAGRS